MHPFNLKFWDGKRYQFHSIREPHFDINKSNFDINKSISGTIWGKLIELKVSL